MVLLFYSHLVTGQIALETAPYSLKWSQINTTNFNILFPRGFEREGNRMANTLEHLYGPVSSSLGIQPRKVDVLLHNHQAISNGFVALGPRRSEFYSMSPQDYNFVGTNDWLDLLAVHEFRHVVQNDKSITGFSRFVYWILGEYALSGIGFAAVPHWFKEGDAVLLETGLTRSGRGRFPSFNMAMRASFLERGPFNYHKQHLRSFKDFVPNHYVLGYHMTSYLQNLYPGPVWKPIVADAWKNSIIPFTFSNSLRKHHGKYVVETYNDMTADVTARWREQLRDLSFTSYDTETRDPSVFTNYSFPNVHESGVIAMKSGLSDIETLVRINESGEEKLFRPGIVNNPGFLSLGKNVIVWTEFGFDPRWDKRSYSVIKSYNVVNKQFQTVTHKTRYSGATISDDDKWIAAVHNLHDGRTQIHILDWQGKLVTEVGNPTYHLISMMYWDKQGESLVAIRQKDGKKAIVRIRLDGSESIVKDYSFENMGHPVPIEGYILYNSPVSGIDNIYALDTLTHAVYQVTSSKYGAFNPQFDQNRNRLVYNDFSVNGMRVVSAAWSPELWKPIGEVETNSVAYFSSDNNPDIDPDVLQTVPDKSYEKLPYKRGSKLFNIHSWGPYFGSSALDYDIGVLFQDVLSMNSGFVGYNYNLDENTGTWKFDYSFEGFYPAIDLEGYIGDRKVLQDVADTLQLTYTWQEQGVNLGVRLPWNFTQSKYQTRLTVSNTVGFNRVTNFSNNIDDNRYSISIQGNGNLVSNTFDLRFTNLLKQSKRDIQSRWGQTLRLSRSGTPYGGEYDAQVTALTGTFFFPGLFRHHNLNFLVAFQHRKITLDRDNYLFSNRVPYPRGYQSSAWENFSTWRVNYDFTVWNADVALGPILNIQRIRARPFYDYGFGKSDVVNFNTNLQIQQEFVYQSWGTEIWFDFNIMRLPQLLSGGLRSVYVQNQGWKMELVIGNIQI